MSFLALWSGCPFISGPPDTSNVGDADDSGDETDTPSATSKSDPVPRVDAFSATPRPGGYDLEFTVVDGDVDLVGGTVRIAAGADIRTFAIPDDLSAWSPDGKGVASWESEIPCTGASVTWSIVITDVGAHVSASRQTSIALAGLGTAPEGPPVDLGAPTLPATVCGSIDAEGDEDRLSWTAQTYGSVTITLFWTGTADLDLYAWDDAGSPFAPSVGDHGAESLVLLVGDAEAIEVGVTHASGNADADWQLVLLASD